ncbi:MAG: hypothetical protein D3910_04635 [Candidatus Electrothrix sp. ATG2]|nr:hypothetical protein [Candidatus Electrothrix sp. ATG2]
MCLPLYLFRPREKSGRTHGFAPTAPATLSAPSLLLPQLPNLANIGYNIPDLLTNMLLFSV